MECTGIIKTLSQDYDTKDYILTLSINNQSFAVTEYERLKSETKLRIKMDKYREKRSLDANAYAWTLISKIAVFMKSDKDSIYELMLQKYGHPYLDENGVTEKISVLNSINISKYGIHTKFIGSGFVDSKEFSHYIVIKGSSEYDTKEMASFIDGIVSDAKELEIETLTPNEVDRMKAMWRQHEKVI